jgi:hypothetical protein
MTRGYGPETKELFSIASRSTLEAYTTCYRKDSWGCSPGVKGLKPRADSSPLLIEGWDCVWIFTPMILFASILWCLIMRRLNFTSLRRCKSVTIPFPRDNTTSDWRRLYEYIPFFPSRTLSHYQIAVSWHVTPCSLVDRYQRLEGNCCYPGHGIIKMEAAGIFETSPTYQAIPCHILGDHNLNIHLREYLESYISHY